MNYKTYRRILNIFWILAITFPIFNLGAGYLGIPENLFTLFLPCVTMYLSYLLRNYSHSTKNKIIFLYTLPLILINIVISVSPLNTLIYWPVYLLMISSIDKIINNCCHEQLEELKDRVPHFLALSSIILYAVLFQQIDKELTTKNSLGLLTGAWLIASIFTKKFRFAYILLSLFILIQSDSRSSILITFTTLLIYFFTQYSLRKTSFLVLTALISFFFNERIIQFSEKLIMQKDIKSQNIEEALAAATEERQNLLENGFELFLKRPIFGYGIKANYETYMDAYDNPNKLGVHNGYLETLLETGIILSLPIYLLIAYLLLHIIKILIKERKLISLPHMLIIYGILRGYGESYLFFNIGNIFSIFFIFYSILIYSKKNTVLYGRFVKY